MSSQCQATFRVFQSPLLVPTIFCQPVACGGPKRLGLGFPTWPILVPGEQGKTQMCYTNDKEFLDAYLQRGFCGLDASFRDLFDYECPQEQRQHQQRRHQVTEVIEVTVVLPAPENQRQHQSGGDKSETCHDDWPPGKVTVWIASMVAFLVFFLSIMIGVGIYISDQQERKERNQYYRERARRAAGNYYGWASYEGTAPKAPPTEAASRDSPPQTAGQTGFSKNDGHRGSSGSEHSTDDAVVVHTPSSVNSFSLG